MCGIVGYIGSKQAPSILMEGLRKLEYRGYDSAGIAVFDGSKINMLKAKGKLVNLAGRLDENPIAGNVGIGHTRWATHGVPSDINSHPHVSGDRTIAVVHNGIIENYMNIKEDLSQKGYKFVSDTDTETVAHLIDFYYKQGISFTDSVFKVLNEIEGAYALAILCRDCPDTIIAARKNCPLIIGLGDGENFISSDIPAILHHTRDVYLLENDEVAIVKKDSVEIFDNKKEPVHHDIFKVNWDIDAAEKDGYDHFMIKEINEQPKIVQDILSRRAPEESDFVNLEGINLTKEDIENISRIYVVACGTAYHAGLIGKCLIEKIARIPVVADFASEFRYKNPILDEKTLVIVISQSGETADTLEALRIAKRNNARVLAIVNTVGSSIAREADDVFYILAGPEISVASTKAFTAQVISMELICCHIAMETGKMTKEEFVAIRKNLHDIPSKISQVIQKCAVEDKLAEKYISSKNVFYIGRGLDYLTSMESSLKLKEIAYLHSEAYAAGELKHGPIAMIEECTLVIAMMTQKELFEKTLSNIKEVKARGAKVIAITFDSIEGLKNEVDDIIYIPESDWMTSPVVANVTTQLFAYYMAKRLGTDVDQPRNLAKSVTVE
ncbi:MAG: glutamine--fructose-6-phosphate transaminase (isomerizing) [Firmicutes bacterium]|nr:glutamine--fructose-6-phosphate transaminase (isomerizing) [Bacillota bacterium]